MDFAVLQTRLADLDRRMTGLQALRDERARQLKAIESQVRHLITETELTEQVESVLIQVSQKVLAESTESIDQLLTTGIRLVFDDQNLTFKTSVDRYRGKTAICFHLLENGQEAPIMEGYGGGVIAIVGVLLRVITIVTLKLRRVLFLDETLSHLADVYVPNASKLLKKIATELDFTILMVTHNQLFADQATAHFRAKRTASGTIFEPVKD